MDFFWSMVQGGNDPSVYSPAFFRLFWESGGEKIGCSLYCNIKEKSCSGRSSPQSSVHRREVHVNCWAGFRLRSLLVIVVKAQCPNI